ncbi:MAG: glycoside hydrolase family 16 protein [Cyclobacteriaceae bacterium]
MKNQLVLFLVLFISFFGCSEDPEINGSEPSDLAVDILISEDGSGLVKFTATATNASLYTFYSGESGSDTLSNQSGEFEYTYLLTGLYEIEVRAYGETERFLKESKIISVKVGEETGPIDGENGYITPLSYEGMKLIWQDEFEGNSLKTKNWNYEIGRGNSGWGNNELQYYRQENTTVADGFLTIEAKRETFSGASYTSSRLTTEDKFDFSFGRVDIRAKMPAGKGIWPALWMLGANFRSAGWPSCGEIDIMEMIGGGDGFDNVTHGTVHWDNDGSYASFGGKRKLLQGNLSDKFHVYSIVWTPESILWYIDDVQYHGFDITKPSLSEFQKDFFFIINVAVGGNWPGSPNSTTLFPQRMHVDYVRVFQLE